MIVKTKKTVSKGKTRTIVDISRMTNEEYRMLCKAVEIANANDKTFDQLLEKIKRVGIEREIINL